MMTLKNEKGLTVIETIIALFLIGILIAAFSNALVTVLRSEVEIDKRLKASSLASGVIEYLGEGDNFEQVNYYGEVYINSNYNLVNGDNNLGDLSSLEDSFFNDIIFKNNSNENEDNVSKIVIDENFGGMDNLYEVTVKIFWRESGETRSLSLVTLLDGGIGDEEND